MFKKKKDKRLSVEEMIDLEKRVKNSVLFSIDLFSKEQELAEILKLKLEYVSDMDADDEGELLPIESADYLGLIRIKKEEQQNKFAYIHEIIHYVFDVGQGNRVTQRYTRKKRGRTNSHEEQKINYMAAAVIMRYDDVLHDLMKYDISRPKLDEITFIRGLQKKYGQSELAICRRIREIRRIEKRRKSAS